MTDYDGTKIDLGCFVKLVSGGPEHPTVSLTAEGCIVGILDGVALVEWPRSDGHGLHVTRQDPESLLVVG